MTRRETVQTSTALIAGALLAPASGNAEQTRVAAQSPVQVAIEKYKGVDASIKQWRKKFSGEFVPGDGPEIEKFYSLCEELTAAKWDIDITPCHTIKDIALKAKLEVQKDEHKIRSFQDYISTVDRRRRFSGSNLCDLAGIEFDRTHDLPEFSPELMVREMDAQGFKLKAWIGWNKDERDHITSIHDAPVGLSKTYSDALGAYLMAAGRWERRGPC